MTDIPVKIVYKEVGANQVKRSFKAIESSAKKTSLSTAKLDKSLARTGKSSAALAANFRSLGAVLLGGFGVRAIIRYSDEYKKLSGRLAIISKDFNEVAKTQEDLFKVAQRTRQPLEGITNFYSRLAQFIPEAERAQFDLLKVTESVSAALAITGETGASATAAMVQFSQAIGTNFESAGQEIRSLQEQAPRLTKALVSALGGGTQSLKQLQEAGKLTRSTVLNALSGTGEEAKKLADELAKIPLTVGQAFTRLDNSFLRFIGKSKEIESSTALLADAITGLAKGLDVLAGNTALVETAFIAITAAFALFFPVITAVGVIIGSTAMAAKFLYDNFTPVQEVVDSVGQAFSEIISPVDALRALFITVSGEAAKFSISIVAVGNAMLQGFISPFKKIAALFRAFSKDLKEFIANPFGDSSGFDNLKAELETGFTEAFKGAFDSAIKEGEEFNKFIDDEVTQRLAKVPAIVKPATKALTDLGKKPKAGIKELSKETKAFDKELRTLARTVADDVTKLGMKPLAKELFEVEALVRDNAVAFATMGAAGKKMVEQIKEGKTEIAAFNDKLEKSEELADALKKPFENALEDVQSSFSSMFEGIFSGGIDSFSSLADSVKGIFIKLAAQIATLMVFQPQVLNAAGGVGGVAQGIMSGGSSFGGGGSLLSNGMSILSGGLNTPIFAPTGLIGGGINSIGNSLGLGVGADFIGPSSAGALNGASGLSNAFTPATAIGGVAGGYLADSIFGDDRGIGASIGSMGGGIAGAAGAAGSSAMLATFGVAAGPIGALVGAFVGSALGGLIGGGKPSDKTQSTTIDLESGEFTRSGFTGKKYSKENAEQADMLAGIAQAMATGFGTTGKNKAGVTVGSRDGYALQFEDSEEILRYNSGSAFIEGLTEELVKRTPDISETITTALSNIDFTDVEQALSDIDFASTFDKLGQEIPAAMGWMEAAGIRLDAAFALATETAERLGLSVEKVAEAHKNAAAQMRKPIYESVFASIISQSSPALAAIQAETARHNALMKDAATIGVKTGFLEIDHQIKMKKLAEQLQNEEGSRLNILMKQADEAERLSGVFGKIVDDLGLAVNRLRIGDLSTLSPEDKVSEARSLFQSTSAAASLGDVDAMKLLPQIGGEFLQVARDFFGSSAGYVEAFTAVEDGLENARDTAERQEAQQARVAEQARAQSTQMIASLSSVSGSNQELVELQRHGIEKAISFYEKSGSENAEFIAILKRVVAI